MSEPTSETPDLSSESMHFQMLLAGTLIFLFALFWFTDLPHTNTHQAQAATAASGVVIGVQVLSCYLAFVSVVFGHKLLRRRTLSKPHEQDQALTRRSTE